MTVTSADPHMGETIRVTVHGREAGWHPADTAVVLAAEHGGERSAWCCRCPYITFHASTAAARAHLQAAGLRGHILTQSQALEVGAFLFANLLQPETEDAPASRLAQRRRE